MAKHGDLITDGGVVWRVIDKRINGKVADIPNYYQRSGLFTASGSILTTPDELLVNIEGQGYIGGSVAIDLNQNNSWDQSSQSMSAMATRAGRDIYIYLVQTEQGTLKFLLSTNASEAYGYTNTCRKVGGFHCLCASVGNISGHPLAGMYAGEILQASIWDLDHRPIADPAGMLYCSGIGKWVDIYLNSWDGLKLVSKYGGDTADGASSKKFHGELFAEELGKVGKMLPSRDEFIAFAKGSNEKTAISGSKDWGTAGGHVDTANVRMISNDGIEDCCGFLIQWTRSFYSVQSNGTWGTGSIYNSSVDSQTYGQAYDPLYRAHVGGDWGSPSYCGSRCVLSNNHSSSISERFGARGVSKTRPID